MTTEHILSIGRSPLNAIGKMEGYSGCYRCGDRWNWKTEHKTMFNESRGCFPLCEECWSELAPETRLPFYRALAEKWGNQDRWPEIKSAVLEGK